MSWGQIQHGYICERLIGFSLPIEGEIAVISYEGVHVFRLEDPNAVTHHLNLSEGGDVYDWKQQRLELNGCSFSILGLHGGNPRLSSSRGERLVFDKGDRFTVYDGAERELFSRSYTDMSGDWRTVTFTPDDAYILLGLPYDLEIFKRAT